MSDISGSFSASSHPNIVPVHDIGIDSSGSPYFTMKLLRGRTLATTLKKLRENDPEYTTNFPFKILIRFFMRICNAIAFAHSQGVLHLDLKPENVQIGDYGEVLVLDWGLARKVQQRKKETISSDPVKLQRTHRMKRLNSQITQEQINGTPGYMAPEQITGSRLTWTEQTDVYSLGAILYAIITHENPLETQDVEQMLRDTISGNIVRPSLRVKDREIPYGLEAVVMKAMSLDPRDRYPSVVALRDDVMHFMEGNTDGVNWISYMQYRHSRAATVTFYDGHIEMRRYGTLNDKNLAAADSGNK